MVQAFQEQGREIPVSTGPSTAVAIPTIVPNVSPEKTGEFRYPTIRNIPRTGMLGAVAPVWLTRLAPVPSSETSLRTAA